MLTLISHSFNCIDLNGPILGGVLFVCAGTDICSKNIAVIVIEELSYFRGSTNF